MRKKGVRRSVRGTRTILEKKKNRPSGVFRAACFYELCMEQIQFDEAGYLAAFEDIRQFWSKEWETLSG